MDTTAIRTSNVSSIQNGNVAPGPAFSHANTTVPIRIEPKAAGQQAPREPSPPRPSSIKTYHNAVQFSSRTINNSSALASVINVGNITHVFYAAANIEQDGTVRLDDEHLSARQLADGVPCCVEAVTRLRAENRFLKVLLSIVGDTQGGMREVSEAFAKTALDKKKRCKFVESARSLVDTYGLDGIDVAWDNVAPNIAHYYILLLAELREALPRPHYQLTASLSYDPHLDLRNIAELLDLINLKCFDFATSMSSTVAHASQTYSPYGSTDISCDSFTQYCISQGVPAGKIMLGIPAFGRRFPEATQLGEDYTRKRCDSKAIPYFELAGTFRNTDMDDGAKACSLNRGGESGLISFDNPWSIRHKAILVQGTGLAGLIFWEALGDSQDSVLSIVSAGYEELFPGNIDGSSTS